jgi:23S rRNA (pseudouridine1915-N3)-methyltransferase
MNIKIITIGQPKLEFAKSGFAEYVKRLQFFHRVEIRHLKDGVKDKEVLKEGEGLFRIILDEQGKEFDSSRELAEFLENKAVQGQGNICFIIGGPEGLSEKVKKHADLIWSLSRLTFPHDLAMVILAEALYRAGTISAGHPYHKE